MNNEISYNCMRDWFGLCGCRKLSVVLLKSPLINFLTMLKLFSRLDPCPTACNMLQMTPCPHPLKPVCTWLWIEAKCMRYFYPESMISLDLSWCRLLAKAIACTWPVGAGGVGTQPQALSEGWNEGGIGMQRCLCVLLLWNQEAENRGRGGAVVDGRIPLRPSLLVLPRRWASREDESARKAGCEREKEKLKRKHNYSDSEQLTTQNLLPVWQIRYFLVWCRLHQILMMLHFSSGQLYILSNKSVLVCCWLGHWKDIA